ncbi:MAG: histidinol dehydrogenase [Deferribacterota bacterium]|nr:histidinol dehydrogenase [Deferribacterota bacterium]
MDKLDLIIDRYSDKIKRILNRGYLLEEKYLDKVSEILNEVRKFGDKALAEYTAEFDGYELGDKFYLTHGDLKRFYDKQDDFSIKSLEYCKDHIEKFHRYQLTNSFISREKDGVLLGELITPIEKVGVYTPGGKASYPTSVIMNVVPAKVAGVKDIYLATPFVKGKINDIVMAAAYIAGVSRVYSLGGAQAVGAFAYGTESVPKVDKIVGPGNIFVSLAKKIVFGTVDIDMIAGPTELVIIADENSDPIYVAADMLAQAEHDELALVLCFTTTERHARLIEEQVNEQLRYIPKLDIAKVALNNFGGIIVFDNIEAAFDIANEIAPEHLELQINNPLDYISLVRNAGAVFIGNYSPNAVGDYIAGPNHTLPTTGSARFFSPLGVYDFIKRTSLIKYSREALQRDAQHIITLADHENLQAHKKSIEIRLKK